MANPQIMYTVISVNGEAFIQTANGGYRALNPGDTIPEGAVIISRNGAVISLGSNGLPVFNVDVGSGVILQGGNQVQDLDPGPADFQGFHGPTSGPMSLPPGDPGPGNHQPAGNRGDGDTGQEEGSHGFIRVPKIAVDNGVNPDLPGASPRDVNETHEFDPRATLNPRVSDSFGGFKSLDLPETGGFEDPFDGATEQDPPVPPGNQAPAPLNDTGTTDEESGFSVAAESGLLSNDTDPDGDPLVITGVSGGAGGVAPGTSTAGSNGGTFTVNADGSYSFDPGADFQDLALGESRNTSVTYTVSDGEEGTATAVLTVTVTGANDGLTASPDSASTDEDTSVTIDVLDNDIDTDGDPITVTAADASHGTVTINLDGTLTYTPDEDYHGPDTINYSVTDGNGSTSSSTVSVTVNSVSDGVADSLATSEDAPVTRNVLNNDKFGSNAEVTSVTQGTNGTVTFNANGDITYTPAADYNGTDSFTYTVTTAAGDTETVAVNVTVSSVVDIVADTVTTDEDKPVTTNVLANDSFEGTPSVTEVTQGSNGTVVNNGDGTVTYTPDEDFHGSDSYTYTVTSGGVTETATVNVTVNSVSDGVADSLTTSEDAFVVVNVLENDKFGSNAEVTSVTQGTNGTVTFNANGNVTYTPNGDYHGSDAFTYTVTTAAGDTETVAVNVTVSSVVDIASDTVTTNEDTAVTTDVLDNDSFEGTPVVTAVTQGANGAVTNNGDGTVTYAPGEDFHGSDSYTYTVTSGGVTETATVNVTVGSVADTVADSLTTSEETVAAVNVLANDTFGPGARVTSVTQGGHGSVNFDADGDIIYTPITDYNGADSFTYTVTTAAGNTETATVNVTVNSVVDIAADSLTTSEDAFAVVNVLENDTFGPSARVTSVTQGGHGSVSFDSDGDIIYTPIADYNGADSFTYTVTSGGVTENATVNVTVSSVVDIAGDTVTTDEDKPVTTNVLANDSFEGTPSVTEVTQGSNGTVVNNGDGTVTYTPDEDFHGSDSYTYTVTSGGVTETATVNVTVDSVNDDAPILQSSSVSTNEDTMVDLGLTVPEVRTDTDHEGAKPAERLGFITLTSVDTGAEIYKGDDTTLLFTGNNNTMSIVIVDGDGNLDTSLHYTDLSSDDNYASAVKLTQAEFAALKMRPASNRHNNIDMTLRATSYETDGDGNLDVSVDGAPASKSVHVEVLAVTDVPSLTLQADADVTVDETTLTATIAEDATLDLADNLVESFIDTDGSEKLWYTVTGLAAGTRVAINGVTYTAGEDRTVSTEANKISVTSAGQNPSFTITPPQNFSGDMTGVTITLNVQDADSDSTVTAEVKQESVTLDMYVNPVADAPTAPNVSTSEDTAVKFLEHLAVTDTDGSEAITAITVNDVPTGWVITNASGDVVHTGDGSADYTIPGADVSNNSYLDYTITPPADSGADTTLSVSVTTTDTQTVNDSSVTNTATTDISINVDVQAVTDTVDLKINGSDDSHTATIDEDAVLDLDALLSASFVDTDGSEGRSIIITNPSGNPAIVVNGTTVNAGGSITISAPGLSSSTSGFPEISIGGAANFSGDIEGVTVILQATDTDSDSNGAIATSTDSVTLNLDITPKADDVTLALKSPASGTEDTSIPLTVRPTSIDTDGSETFTVEIADIPDGAALSYNGSAVTVSEAGVATITEFNASNTLSITPPAQSNVDFTLKVSSWTVETIGGDIGDTTGPLDLLVKVSGDADAAEVAIATPQETESDIDAFGGSISLSELITSATTVDTDGSETITFRITGLQAGFDIEGATFTGGTGTGRVWLLTTSQLDAGATLEVPQNFSGTVNFTARPVVTENDGDSWTGNILNLSAQITPSPEGILEETSTTANEDTLQKVDFSIDHQNGDTDEKLSSVWISKDSFDAEGQNFSLYLGNSTDTTLAAAAGDAGETDVVSDGGWYKITGDAIGNIYVLGDSDTHGNYSLTISYGVTDPSSDTPLDSVETFTGATYGIDIDAVTDPASISIDTIGPGDKATVVGTTVTATDNTTVTVNVHLDQIDKLAEGNGPDVDGSEQATRFIIDGVPYGVTVEDGVYIGDTKVTPLNENTGRWIVNFADVAFDADGIDKSIVFHLDGDTTQLANLDQTISIGVESRDTGGSLLVSEAATWTLVTGSDFDANSPATPVAAAVSNWSALADDAVTVSEDNPATLGSLINSSLAGEEPGDFSVTLTGLPAGSTVTGMEQMTVGGETLYTVSDLGGTAVLQSLLNSVSITAPQNQNSNTPTTLEFNATLTTYSAGGGEVVSNAAVSQTITPVTDKATLQIVTNNGTEDNSVDFSVTVNNPADGTAGDIVDGKLYLTVNDGDMADGTLSYGGSPISTESVSGVPGVDDGDYFVVTGVGNGDTLTFTYTPAANASGTVNVSSYVVEQETGASNTVTTNETDSFQVAPANDGYDMDVAASGTEDNRIELSVTGSGLVDTDGSESAAAAVLKYVPNGFLVYTGADADSAVLAGNMGDDGTGNSTNTWSIPISGNCLPDYIAVRPPANYSGTVGDLELTVLTGESGLDPEETSVSFDMDVEAEADPITLSPTKTFGPEGGEVSINLNATMGDTDGSETVTLTLTGDGSTLPEGMTFSSGGDAISAAYDSGVYTLAGVTASQINELEMQPPEGMKGDWTIGVTAVTVDGTNSLDTPVTGSFDVALSSTPSGVTEFTASIDSDVLDTAISGDNVTPQGYEVPLVITGLGLVDADGTETLAIRLSGLGDLLEVDQSGLPTGVTATQSGGDWLVDLGAPGANFTAALNEFASAGLKLVTTGETGSLDDFSVSAYSKVTATAEISESGAQTLNLNLAVDNDGAIDGTDSDDIITGSGEADTINAGAGDDVINGGAGNDTINGGDGDDEISGGSGDDTVNAGAGNDTISSFETGDTVDGGDGTDTVALSSGVTLDFSGTVNLSNIEILDLEQGGSENHSVSDLSLQDVLDVTGSGDSLYILGDGGDSVSLDEATQSHTEDEVTTWDSWSTAETQTIDDFNGSGHSVTFDVYTNSFDASVYVYIEQDISDSVI